MLKNDSGNKSIILNGEPDDNSESTAIIIYQQASYINFKIENDSLVVTKTYQIYLYNIWRLRIDSTIKKLKN